MAVKRFGSGDFYCAFCGARREKDASVCPRCGAPYDDETRHGCAPSLGAGGIGWSENAAHPSFQAYRKQSARAGVIFLLILTVLAFVILLILGKLEGKNLYIFLGVAGAIWLFDLCWILWNNKGGKDWEGVLQRKRAEERREVRRGSDGGNDVRYHTDYILTFRTKEDKKKRIKRTDDASLYNYLREGEYVRHIGRLRYIEKYDKSRDPYIPCAACGQNRDARDNFCGRCGAVLLKAPVPAQIGLNDLRPSAAPPSAQQAGLCPLCGAVLNPGAKFCIRCGARVE